MGFDIGKLLLLLLMLLLLLLLSFAPLIPATHIIRLFYSSACIPQPFVEDSVILDLFPPRLYAIIIPATILVAVISIVGTFIGYVLLKEARKSKKK